jgi:outer membrane receptor protein involved in Fe transport
MDFESPLRGICRRRYARALLLFLGALLPISAARAQVMEEVTVTGSAVGASDAATQGSIDAQQLEEFPTYRPGELLETVPGLIVTQHSGEGKANQYFLRGFNLDHGTDIDISLAGMPVNLRTHAHGQGYADLNFMIPELVKSIDYSKGPYYADKGDFDTAGAVTIDYVDTLPHDLASVSAGTLGDYRDFTAMSRPWRAGNMLLATEYDHVDGPWAIPDNYNKGNLVLRYSQGAPANGFSVTGMFMDDAWHATNQITEPGIQQGLLSGYGPLDPTDGGSSERYSLSTKFAQTDDAGQWKADAYAIGYALQLFNNFDGFVSFPTPGLNGQFGDQFEQQERRKLFGGDVGYTKFGKIFDRESDNTVGFQTRTDLNHMGLYETTDRTPSFAVRTDKILETSGGLFYENRTQWLDWVRAVAGVREDIFYGSDSSAPFALNSGTTAKGMFSPKANVVLGPWQKTELYLSYGQGFHSNDLRGALTAVDAFTTETTGAFTPQGKTPLLTKAEGYEIGVRTEIVPQVTASAALFVLNLASEATFDGDSAGTSVGRPSNRTGIELSTAYAPLDWLSFNGDLAFTRARFTNADDGSADVWPGHPGSYIPEAAKMIASAEAAVQNLGPWDGGLRMRYFGPRPLTEDGSIRSGPTLLFDARAGYRFNPVWHLQLDIFNLFNSHAHQIDYFYQAQVTPTAPSVYGIAFKPVEPLSGRLTLAATF